MNTILCQSKKKVVQRVQKYSVVLKNLDQFIRPEMKGSDIAHYLNVFDLLYKFCIQSQEDPSLRENDYDLNSISFLLNNLRTARSRVDMDLLQSSSLFHPINSLSLVADY